MINIEILTLNQIREISLVQINSTKQQNFGLTNLKAFADHKFNVAKMMFSLFDWIENIVGKGEMLVTSIFSFLSMFSKGLILIQGC